MEYRDLYLARLAPLAPHPNFWVSREYMERAGWEGSLEDGCLLMVDDEGQPTLPWVHGPQVENRPCWATFSDCPPEGDHWEFLDYEFIYNPQDFLALDGGKWRTVRKNISAARADIAEELALASPDGIPEATQLAFLNNWAISHQGDMYDADVMADYLLHGEHRTFMVGAQSGGIYAELVWDANWAFTNFRYCIVKDGIRGLSDLARVMFYRNVALPLGRLVNDGGSLGRESLHEYKLRLNPQQVGKIYTWRSI